MRVTCCAVVALIVVLFAGCTDKTVNNYYSNEIPGISGLLSPPDGGTVVATAGEHYESTIDELGYFEFIGLKPGVYRLSVHPNHHTRRELSSIVVVPGSMNFLTVPITNYPYPIVTVYPPDTIKPVSGRETIYLTSDERLNISDFDSGVTFHPMMAGSWSETSPAIQKPSSSASVSGYGGASVYYFIPDSQWIQGVKYDVTIDAAVRTWVGVPLGADLTFRFSTKPAQPAAPLIVKLYLSPNQLTGHVALADFRPILSFNECVFPDSLRMAVTILPRVEGIWTTSGTCQDGFSAVEIGDDQPSTTVTGTQFMLFPIQGVPLQAETEYSLVVNDWVALTGSSHLPAPDTFRFVTEPYGVTSVLPQPWTSAYGTSQSVYLEFNTDMDTASVQSQFQLREVGGPVVSGRFKWTGAQSTVFNPDGPLRRGTPYWIFLSPEARRSTGETLTHDFESYFAVQ